MDANLEILKLYERVIGLEKILNCIANSVIYKHDSISQEIINLFRKEALLDVLKMFPEARIKCDHIDNPTDMIEKPI